jgi:hypothetical protein
LALNFKVDRPSFIALLITADVLAGASFMCDETVVLTAAIAETPCVFRFRDDPVKCL